MAKQLNIDLNFRADTSKAKQSINELQQSIQKLGYSTIPKDIVNPEAFKQAAASARELSYHLQNAYNSKTGNLDLSKLSSSLKSSNTSLTDLTKNFSSAGQVGQQAFISLAKSIAVADQPSLSLNTHLSTLWTTLKNVARFQLTSSIIHGLVGGVQNALHYAQDLNTSLNNIRIVTGQSVDQMATFAKEANNAARALSTSTLKYTDAALIYYQQGLSDKEVKERTDVTVKLANVTKQSAEEVSSQLTAIWNNFDDGTKSLEYYADVITKLGASTASSSDEIAEGLSKFASVADTVGLSYEKATAALATVVAETRQSADVVGTAFKTMFARFQGLSLGKTLEDGVDLNKYSKALKTVGVEVLETNGELRRMDDILNDTYSRWNDISEAQRVALAETVAGTRQYAQFMALMNNYGKILSNQQLAANSTGTLQDQADIYAESWEAAKDRVKAAAESVYDALIDEDFFIKVDKVTETALGGLSKFIENFGGVKALLGTVFSFALSMLSTKIGPAVQKIVQDIQILSGGANKIYTKMQNEFTQITQAEIGKHDTSQAMKEKDFAQYTSNVNFNAELTASNQLLLAKTKLSAINDKLSASERMRNEVALSGIELEAERIQELAQEKIEADKQQLEMQEKVNKAEWDEIKIIQKARTEKEQLEDKTGLLRISTSEMQDSYTREQDYLQQTNGTMFNKAQSIINSKAVTNGNFLQNLGLSFEDYSSQLQQAARDAYAVGLDIKQNLMDGFYDKRGMQNVDISEQLSLLFDDSFESVSSSASQEEIQARVNQIEVLRASLNGAESEVSGLKEAFDSVSQAKTPEAFNAAILKLYNACEKAVVPADKLEKALIKMGANPANVKNYAEAIKELNAAEAELEKVDKKLKEAQDGTPAKTAAMEEYAQAEERAKKAGEALAEAEKHIQDSVADFNPAHTMTALEGITKTAAGFGQVVTVINGVKSAIRTLGDESASVGEKITSSFMAISMGIPAVIGAYNNFATVINGVKNATILSTVANNKNLFSKTALATAGGKEAATEALVAAGVSESSAAKYVETAATEGLAAANETLKLSMIEIVAIAAAVAAIVAILVLAFKHLYEVYNADAIAAKKAAKASEELRKASEEAAQKAQEIKSAFDGYDKAIETLKNCTKGTKEWQEALSEVNNQVLSLLEKYPDLNIQTTRKNGYLEITNEADIIKQAEDRSRAAQSAAIIGNVVAQQAALTAKITEQQRKYTAYTVDPYAGTVEDYGTTYARSSVLANAQDYFGKTLEETKIKLQDNGLWEQLKMSDTQFESFYKSLQELGKETEKVANSLKTSSEQIVENTLGDQYDEATKAISAKFLQASTRDYIEDYKKYGEELGAWSTRSEAENNQLFKDYKTYVGDIQLDNNAVLGLKNNRSFKLADGTSITLDAIAEQVASARAIAELTGTNAIDAKALVNNLKQKNYGNDLINFLTNGTFENSTQTAVEDLLKKAGPNGEGLLDYFEVADAEEFEKKYNIKLESVIAMLNTASEGFREIGNTLSSIPQQIYQESGISNEIKNLTLAQQREIVDSFQQIYNKLGPTATKGYSEILKSLGDEGSKFSEIFTNFDFSSGTTEEFIQALEDAGIDTNDLSDEIHHLADEMVRASGAALGLSKITANHKEMNDIVGKLKIGGSISPEDYQKLFNQNKGFADFFQKNINGEYDLLSTPEAVQAFMDQITQQQIDKSFDILEQGKNDKSLDRYAGGRGGQAVDYDLVRKQLDFLGAAGIDTSSYETAYDNASINGQQTAEIIGLIEQLQNDEAQYNETIKEKNELTGTMATSLAHLSQLEQDQKVNQDGVTAGLKKLGGQYESTIPLVQKLTQLEKESKKGSDEYKKASHELWQEIRKQEWAEVIGNIEKHIKALADEKSSNEELRKAYIAIAKEFNDKFKLGLTPEQVAAHKKQFIDLANADADKINDLALSIESILAAEEAGIDGTMVKIGDSFMSLKDYIEANPIQVDAEGHADMTGLIQGLLAAGASAEQVAAILEAIGQTNVTIAGTGTSIGTTFDSSDPESWSNFINELNNYRGIVRAGGTIPKITGTGARDYTQKINSGSGGGGGKDKKNEIDRYHEELAVIKDLEREYDKLGKAKDRAWGANKLAYLDAEIDKTKDLIAAQDKYLQAIRSNLQPDYDAALGVAQELGFDHYGDDNWTAVQTALEQSRRDKKINNETYTERKKLLDKYIETLNLLKDEEAKFMDLVYQAQDQIQEEITAKIDLRLELKANDLQKIEYALKKIGDNAFKRVEALSNLFSTDTSKDTKTSTLVKSLQDYNQEYEEIQRLHQTPLYTAEELQQKKEKEGLSDDAVEALRQQMQMSDADYIENLKRVKDGIYDDLNALQDLRQEMREYYSDTLAKGQEEIDKLTNSLAHQSEVLEHLKEVFELTGDALDYDVIGAILTTGVDVAKDEQDAAIAEFKMYEQQVKERQEALNNAVGEEAIEIAKHNLEVAQQYMTDAENKMYDKTKAYLESIKALAKNEADKTKKAIDDVFTDGLGWDYINKSMELSEKTADKYLTKTNQVYETNKLLRDIAKDIDKTTSQNAKAQLSDFSKRIAQLQQVESLSKNTLEIMKQQYTVLQAQIALKEAQDAKSTVRLQRDSAGNYGYVYTADQDQVREAEQALEDAENGLYNLVREQENDTAKEIMEINQQKTQELYDLWVKYYVDKTMTAEEYNAQSVMIEDKYSKLLEATTKDHLLARELLQSESVTKLNDTWTAEFDELVAKGQSHLLATDEFWQETFGVVISGSQAVFDATNPKWSEFLTGLETTTRNTKTTIDGYMSDLKKAMVGEDGTEGYMGKIKDGADALGKALGAEDDESLAHFVTGLKEKFDELDENGADPSKPQTYLDNIKTKADELTIALAGDGKDGSGGLIKAIGDQNTEVGNAVDKWSALYDQLTGDDGVITAAERTTTAIHDLLEEANKTVTTTIVVETKYVTSGNPTTPPTVDPTGYTGAGDGDDETNYYVTNIDGSIVDGPFANAEKNEANRIANLRSSQWSQPFKVMTEKDYKDFCLGLKAFDTGGYTGSWAGGSDLYGGKLAMLHEKEIVLNQEDTKNLLASVSIIRELAQAIDLRAAASSLSSGLYSPMFEAGSQALEQTVTIHAEFPNATDRSEIEAAFESLVNQATQYAHSNRR